MSLQAEVSKLTPVKRAEQAFNLFLYGAMMAVAYFFDEARVAAFGIIPFVAVINFARDKGVSWRSTPRLFVITYITASTFLLGAFLWVLNSA